jgi:cation transport ATPase
VAEANASVAIGSALRPLAKIGNVLLFGNDQPKFIEVLQIADWTQRNIWQDSQGTITVSIAGIGLAARRSIPSRGTYSCGFRVDLCSQFGKVTSPI